MVLVASHVAWWRSFMSTVHAFVSEWQATAVRCIPYRGHVICTISVGAANVLQRANLTNNVRLLPA